MAIAALGLVYLTRIGVESSYSGAALPAVMRGVDHRRNEAAVHGTTAFWWAAGILAAGAIVTRLLFERGHRTAPAHGPAPAVPETG